MNERKEKDLEKHFTPKYFSILSVKTTFTSYLPPASSPRTTPPLSTRRDTRGGGRQGLGKGAHTGFLQYPGRKKEDGGREEGGLGDVVPLYSIAL